MGVVISNALTGYVQQENRLRGRRHEAGDCPGRPDRHSPV